MPQVCPLAFEITPALVDDGDEIRGRGGVAPTPDVSESKPLAGPARGGPIAPGVIVPDGEHFPLRWGLEPGRGAGSIDHSYGNESEASGIYIDLKDQSRSKRRAFDEIRQITNGSCCISFTDPRASRSARTCMYPECATIRV